MDSSGNLYVSYNYTASITLGGKSYFFQGGQDFALVKLTSKGVVSWVKTPNSTGHDHILDLGVDGSGNVYVLQGNEGASVTIGGKTYPSTSVIITKYDSSGTVKWSKGSTGTMPYRDKNFQGLRVDTLGNVYIAGYASGTYGIGTLSVTAASNEVQTFVAKLDTTGKEQWIASSTNHVGRSTSLYNIAVDSKNNVYVSGQLKSVGTYSFGTASANNTLGKPFFVAKLDANGSWQWVVTSSPHTTNTYSSYTTSLEVDGNDLVHVLGPVGRQMVVGSTTLSTNESQGLFVASLNGSGAWQSASVILNKYAPMGSSLARMSVDASGNRYVTTTYQSSIVIDGKTYSTLSNKVASVLFKVSPTGSPVWVRNMTGKNGVYAKDTTFGGGSVYVGGIHNSQSNFAGRVFSPGSGDDGFIWEHPTAPTCSTGESDCFGACANLQSDTSNCGTCGNACGAGLTCIAGTCSCPAGKVNCNGDCINISDVCVSTLAKTGLTTPHGLVLDSNGDLIVTGHNSHKLYKVTSQGVATLLGGSSAGLVNGPINFSSFNQPQGLAFNGSGQLFIADTLNHVIRRLASNVTTSHSGTTSGFANGNSSQTQFNRPADIAIDSSGNLFIVDSVNNRIRKVDTSGNSTTLAGSTQGYKDGTGTAAQFNNPQGIAIDSSGNLYVADSANHRIRKITSAGVVTTIAGSGVAGFKNGDGTGAQFDTPLGITVDSIGNLFVSDNKNHAIRKIDPQGKVTTLAGAGSAGSKDGGGTNSTFNEPAGVAVLSDKVFVADRANNSIRVLKLPCATTQTFCSIACRDLQNDNTNCGTCGNACTGGNTCQDGVCKSPCSSGETLCSGVCKNLQTDSSNCGTCGTACPSGQTCQSGSCAASFTQLSAGKQHTCAKFPNGSVKCWGDNTFGQLGDGTTNEQTSVPLATVNLGTGRTATQVQILGRHTCAILDNGDLACWGQNHKGQLGNGTTTSVLSPTKVNVGTGRTVKQLALGPAYTCVILDNDTVKCWGQNTNGELGNGTTTDLTSPPTNPVDLGSGRTAKSISAGASHVCAILDNDKVKCWGLNYFGEIGIGGSTGPNVKITTPLSTTINLGSGRTAKQVEAGSMSTCALLDNDMVKCWGRDNHGFLGLNNGGNLNVPSFSSINFGSGRIVKRLFVSKSFNGCVVLDNDAFTCWGYNLDGMYGFGNKTNLSSPSLTPVNWGSGRTVKKLFWYPYSTRHMCALLDNDTIKCTGIGFEGRLGQGNTTDFTSPPANPVTLGKTVKSMALGESHTCAVLSDNSVKCWGPNSSGQLGIGNKTFQTSPQTVSGIP